MNQKKVIMITLGALILLSISWLGLSRFQNSQSCHGQPVFSAKGEYSVFASTDVAYLVVATDFHRPAVGLCAFPDGGSAISLHESLDLYQINISQKSARRIASLSDFNGGYIAFTSNALRVTHKNMTEFFGEVRIEYGPGSSETRQFIANTKTSTLQWLTSEQYNLATAAANQINGSFDFDDQGRYLKRYIPTDDNGNAFPFGMPYTIAAYKKGGSPLIILSGVDWLGYNISLDPNYKWN